MRIIECEQNSPAWLNARIGVVTASNMHRVVNTDGRLRRAKTGDGLAQTAQTYLHELLAEWLLQMPVNADASQFMQRGHTMEDQAADWYAFTFDAKLEKCGFFVTDCGRIGASPDRTAGDCGLLEIKVPGAVQHVANLIRTPEEFSQDYYAQVQTQLYVTGYAFVDLLSFSPSMPSRVVNITRDMEFLANLHDALFGEGGFIEHLEAAKAKLEG